MRKPRITARVTVFMAAKARKAVVLRRGPSKKTQMLSWNLSNDRVIAGQWIKAPVKERECSVSPSGKYFVYFVPKHWGDIDKWTAVSKPPYFTALALWRGRWGDGGGFFKSENHLQLSNVGDSLDERFKLKRGFRVTRFSRALGIWEKNLQQLGWRPAGKEKTGKPNYDFNKTNGKYRLRLFQRAFGQANQAPVVMDFKLFRGEVKVRELEGIDWCDWDKNGDLLYSHEGCLWRLRKGDLDKTGKHARLVADLNANKFTLLEPSAAAKRW